MIDSKSLEDLLGTTKVEVQVAALFRALTEQRAEISSVFNSALTISTEFSPPKIGKVWEGEGGVYAGMMRGENGADYPLIVPVDARGAIKEIEWGGYGVDETGAGSEFDGLANTRALVASSTDHPAAQWADGLEIEGHKDWYLPARRELALIFANIPEPFEKVWVQSSTQCSAYGAWGQYFGDGFQGAYGKLGKFLGVAVRRLVL